MPFRPPTFWATVLAIGLAAAVAEAGEHDQKPGVADDYHYSGPAFIRRVPGVRLLFGDYALSKEEFDALYGDKTEFDESYYEPEAVPAKPRKKPAKNAQQPPARQATVTPRAPAAEAAEPPDAALRPKAPPAEKPSTTIACDKAGAIIGGYGFSSVTPQTCTGKTYAFSASRGDKNFAIKFDSATGELTEVKKLN